MQEEHPKISVVTPSFNQAEFIEENIRSIKAQEYPNVEHIVVDGGSTDGTIDILRKHEDDYDLRWISEDDRGQSHAINKGFEMSSGEWIGWQNSDDFYLPSAFFTFHAARKRYPHADVLYGDLIVVNEEGDELDRAFYTAPSKFIHRHSSTIMSNHSTLFHRSTLKSIGGLQEEFEYTMDAEFFDRMLTSELNMVHIDKFLGCHRIHENAKTFGSRPQRQIDEAAQLRNLSGVERYVPQAVYDVGIVTVKLSYWIRDRRWDAFRYKFPLSANDELNHCPDA